MTNSKQLYENKNGELQELFPFIRIEDIKDEEGKRVLSLINKFNHIYLGTFSNKNDARLIVPNLFRRYGIWISYNYNGDFYTEKYIGPNINIENDNIWTNDNNWEIVPDVNYVNDASLRIPANSITLEQLSKSVIDLLSNGNTIINLADDEDLQENECHVIKFKDRVVSDIQAQSYGYKYLRKNWVNGVNILSSDNINKENTIYVIRYDYDLNNAELTIPENAVLYFQGGSINNGTITNLGKVLGNVRWNNITFNNPSSIIKTAVCSEYGINNDTDSNTALSFFNVFINKGIDIIVDNGYNETITEDNSIVLTDSVIINNNIKLYGPGSIYFKNGDGFVWIKDTNNISSNNIVENVSIKSKGDTFRFRKNDADTSNMFFRITNSVFRSLIVESEESCCFYGGLGPYFIQITFDTLILKGNIGFSNFGITADSICNNINGAITNIYFKNTQFDYISNCYMDNAINYFIYFIKADISKIVLNNIYIDRVINSLIESVDTSNFRGNVDIYINNVSLNTGRTYTNIINLDRTIDSLYINKFDVRQSESLIKCKDITVKNIISDIMFIYTTSKGEFTCYSNIGINTTIGNEIVSTFIKLNIENLLVATNISAGQIMCNTITADKGNMAEADIIRLLLSKKEASLTQAQGGLTLSYSYISLTDSIIAGPFTINSLIANEDSNIYIIENNTSYDVSFVDVISGYHNYTIKTGECVVLFKTSSNKFIILNDNAINGVNVDNLSVDELKSITLKDQYKGRAVIPWDDTKPYFWNGDAWIDATGTQLE